MLDTVNSTNTFAKEKTLTKDYLIVLSEEQTAGRGRQGKTWYSPDSGNIYMSIKFKGKNINAPLSLLVGLLVSEAMDEVSGKKINAGLKWPNDLLINNKKICGILVESEILENEIEFIVGIGINYSLPKKESWWGDIGNLEKVLPREKLINAILKRLMLFIENDYPEWKSEWEKRCIHKDTEISIAHHDQQKITLGTYTGINEEGKILLQTKTGIELVSSGECSIKGIY